MILKIFLWGAFATIPVFFVQIGLTRLLSNLFIPPIFSAIIYWFLIISLTEEIFKYIIVKIKVLNNYEFDEPLDAMLYMVISALGFAAIENILYLFSPIGIENPTFNYILDRTIIITIIRFIGATFLHTLCSALLGYFLALSFLQTKSRLRLAILGIMGASFLHGLYDFSIMTVDGIYKIIIPALILIILAIFVVTKFEKLKKVKSVCKL